VQPLAVDDPVWPRGMRERWDVWRHDIGHDGSGIEAGHEDVGRDENAKEGNEPIPFLHAMCLHRKNRTGSAQQQIICHARYEAA
jgi:hypothetical protein